VNRFLHWILLSVVLAITLSVPASAAPTPKAPDGLAKATFAGGCFWCMETPFYKVKGIKQVLSGYVGGTVTDPTYEQVSAGTTGHAEAVEVVFDPKLVSYEALLKIFWANIDPLAKDQQFCDHGTQYRSAIFTHDAEQAKLANASKAAWQADKRFAGKTIHTEISPASAFYPAEEYHQKYSLKNPQRYKFYRWNCGRDQRLEEVWGKAPAH
jgi:peptide-methionine (S)-S-oxide reductase